MTVTHFTKQIETLEAKYLDLRQLLSIEKDLDKLENLKLKTLDSFFWQNQELAIQVNKEIELINKNLEPFLNLERDLLDVNDLIDLIKIESSAKDLSLTDSELLLNLFKDVENKILKLEENFQTLEFSTLFSEPYDKNNALLSIKAGVGGLDAQDWAQILERMYLRFSQRQGFQVEILNKSYGQEAGIKTLDLRIVGNHAYGYLKSEHGTHRLLRNSPFNADGLRQTSFAVVEVLPEIENQTFELREEDLKIDVFRSSGPGGQSVNTTDSAVRITHLPSNIVVSCQSERSQYQNKENALKILRSKLYQVSLLAHEEELKKLGEGSLRADWGQQVRSYFLYGNKIIKDHRSNYESTNIDAVLDGDLKPLIEAYLRSNLT